MPNFFLSYDTSDAATAQDLQRFLQQVFEKQEPVFWERGAVPEEEYRTRATEFLENTQLFVACLSANYHDTPLVRWELEKALSEYKRRRDVQIVVVLAKGVIVPESLQGFPLAPAPGQPVEGFTVSREIQLQRSVQRIWEVLFQFERRSPVQADTHEYLLDFEDVRERLIVWAEHCDLGPLFLFLKKLLHPERTPDDLFQLEDAFVEWRQQARRTKLNFDLFSQTMAAIRLDLRHLLGRLDVTQFHTSWPGLFADTYYALQPVGAPADAWGGLYLPMGEIAVPDALNNPDAEAGALTLQQQQEFRRNLLLAQDAVGIGHYGRAHGHCEHVRAQIDPQSAQLYELLLLTYLIKETPDRIIREAMAANLTKLNHVIVYAGRLAEYQRTGKCPSDSGWYNLRAVAEALSEAMLREYATFRNDYILHTGRHGKDVPDNRAAIAQSIRVAMDIYRTVHPYRGYLELVVNELCNGGKYDYVRQVEIVRDEFRFASHEDFGLESEIREVVGMLEAISPYDDDALMNRQLRENLFFNLVAKRTRLQKQLAEEQRRHRQFTDVREAVIELVHAALLGFKIFGDRGYPDEQSFLRLAIEQLLPGLLLPTASAQPAPRIADLRWFELDASGEVCNHPDCARFDFDALGIVQKITRDHAGTAAWMQVHPNVKQEVFLQFTADTDAEYRRLHENLQFNDIRRLHEVEARRLIIECLRQWKIAYLAYPESGAEFLRRIADELTGNRLLLWLRFDPPRLGAFPESLALGYDALAEFRRILEISPESAEEFYYKNLAHNLFHRHIRFRFDKIQSGDATQRAEAVSLLLQALHNYRDLHPAAEYLDFVYEELTMENKFRWIDISETGDARPWPYESPVPFDPDDILEQLALLLPERFRLLEARQRIARRRFADLQALYFREISEYTHENRQVERRIAIDIIRKLKGVFRFYPDPVFLEIPLRELEGNGRIRWQENLLGVFPLQENHYENKYFQFDFLRELAEFKMYRDTRKEWMDEVRRRTGEST